MGVNKTWDSNWFVHSYTKFQTLRHPSFRPNHSFSFFNFSSPSRFSFDSLSSSYSLFLHNDLLIRSYLNLLYSDSSGSLLRSSSSLPSLISFPDSFLTLSRPSISLPLPTWSHPSKSFLISSSSSSFPDFFRHTSFFSSSASASFLNPVLRKNYLNLHISFLLNQQKHNSRLLLILFKLLYVIRKRLFFINRALTFLVSPSSLSPSFSFPLHSSYPTRDSCFNVHSLFSLPFTFVPFKFSSSLSPLSSLSLTSSLFSSLFPLFKNILISLDKSYWIRYKSNLNWILHNKNLYFIKSKLLVLSSLPSFFSSLSHFNLASPSSTFSLFGHFLKFFSSFPHLASPSSISSTPSFPSSTCFYFLHTFFLKFFLLNLWKSFTFSSSGRYKFFLLNHIIRPLSFQLYTRLDRFVSLFMSFSYPLVFSFPPLLSFTPSTPSLLFSLSSTPSSHSTPFNSLFSFFLSFFQRQFDSFLLFKHLLFILFLRSDYVHFSILSSSSTSSTSFTPSFFSSSPFSSFISSFSLNSSLPNVVLPSVVSFSVPFSLLDSSLVSLNSLSSPSNLFLKFRSVSVSLLSSYFLKPFSFPLPLSSRHSLSFSFHFDTLFSRHFFFLSKFKDLSSSLSFSPLSSSLSSSSSLPLSDSVPSSSKSSRDLSSSSSSSKSSTSSFHLHSGPRVLLKTSSLSSFKLELHQFSPFLHSGLSFYKDLPSTPLSSSSDLSSTPLHFSCDFSLDSISSLAGFHNFRFFHPSLSRPSPLSSFFSFSYVDHPLLFIFPTTLFRPSLFSSSPFFDLFSSVSFQPFSLLRTYLPFHLASSSSVTGLSLFSPSTLSTRSSLSRFASPLSPSFLSSRSSSASPLFLPLFLLQSTPLSSLSSFFPFPKPLSSRTDYLIRNFKRFSLIFGSRPLDIHIKHYYSKSHSAYTFIDNLSRFLISFIKKSQGGKNKFQQLKNITYKILQSLIKSSSFISTSRSSSLPLSFLGIGFSYSGRVYGAKKAMSFKMLLGSVPFNTLNAPIDYAKIMQKTRNGTWGFQTWLHLRHKTSRPFLSLSR